MNNSPAFGKNITEVIKVKEKFNQLFKDKLFLVMLVLGLLTIVAAAGVVTIQRGSLPGEENPYIQMQDQGAIIAEDERSNHTQVAGSADADHQEESEALVDNKTQVIPSAAAPTREYVAVDPQESKAAQAGTGMEAAIPLVLDFAEGKRMAWPVWGNILLDYSMDSTIYFPTLAQYQVNPGVVIQAEVSDPVLVPANARVMEVGTNEEIGNYVVLDLGNDFAVTCGQMKEIQVVENEYLEAGQILGYVAEPTKYYFIEGSNVYFELRHGGETVDPLDYFE